MIRIIFSDIDGTLLNSKHQITEKTREKILELEAKGIPFILVSARMPSGVRQIQKELENHSPVVCYSGGLILDGKGRQLFSCQMSLDLAIEIKNYIKEKCPEICCSTYGMDQWVVDDDLDFWVKQEEEITKGKACVGDIRELFLMAGGIHKLMFMGEEEDITKAEKLMKSRYPMLNIQKSKPTYLEIMDGNAKKSMGVHLLCQYLGVSETEAMAFGDGENDIDMLKAVREGIAMGNAPETVKQSASFVTKSNDEEGILYIINNIS